MEFPVLLSFISKMSTDSPAREKKRKNAIQENEENYSPQLQAMQSRKKRCNLGRGGAANDPIVLNGLGDDDEIDAVDYAGLHLTLVNMAIIFICLPISNDKIFNEFGYPRQTQKMQKMWTRNGVSAGQ